MTRKRRVLALVTDGFGQLGGIGRYNADFLSSLAKGGEAAVEVLPRHAPSGAATPAGVLQHPPRPGRLAYALDALGRAMASPFDVVFCGHLYMAALAAVVARLSRAQLVVQTHGVEAWATPPPALRAAVERAALVLCVSRDTRARVMAWACLQPERVRVLPNTVQDLFTPGDGASLRARWGLDGRRVLLTVGRLAPGERYKGHDRVIDALPGLVANGCDVAYIVVGEGDDRARLETLAFQRGLHDRVRFMGSLDQGDLVEAYRLADVFVMASTGEGFGIAYLEAMACGTPALGLRSGGACDALADGQLGVLADETELEARLFEMLVRPKPSGLRLAAEVNRRFGGATFAGEQKRILETVMAEAPAGRLR